MGLFDFVTGLVDGDDGTTDGSGRVETSTEDRDEEGGADKMTPADFRGRAAEFADDHGLDFTPASLVRLDELVADGALGVDVDTFAETDPEVCADGADAGPVAAVGAYFGEVFVRSYGAGWTDVEDVGWVVSVPGEEGGGAGTEAGATGDGSDSADDETSDAAAVPIPTVLLDCLVGGGGFAAVHDATLDDLGRSGPRLTASEHPVESD